MEQTTDSSIKEILRKNSKHLSSSHSLIKPLGMACLIAAGMSLLLGCLPASPLLACVCGACGAYAFQKQLPRRKFSFKEKVIFILFCTLSVGFLISYLCTLSFFAFFAGALPDDWQKFEFIHKILHQSGLFKMAFFLTCFVIACLTSCLGSSIAFSLGVGLKKISEAEFVSSLSKKELQEYLE